MKKIFSAFIIFVTMFALVACKKDKPTPTPDPENDINLNGEDFVIMANQTSSVDPRLGTYQGLFKNEKVKAIEDVEKKYNVNVKYVNYPSDAAWGGQRERWIIEQSQSGTAPAHVFEVSSTSVGTLATRDAILPLDDLIETYGPKGYWSEKLVFGEVLGKNYLFDDVYAYSDDGLYYNSELLGNILGKERALEPTKLFLEGKWDWAAFEKLANELNEQLDHERPAAEGGPQYVMGGRTYNWAYPMIGANGGVIVDSNFKSNLNSTPVMDTLDFLSKLYRSTGMWLDDAPLNNASQPEFTAGNIVFHQGISWHIAASNKWGNAKFPIDFVPYPAGTNVTNGNGTYAVNHVYGKPSYAISSAFSKANIPAGYEDKMIHDETIFRIWTDLQHFPEVDATTGKISTVPFEDEFYSTRLFSSYNSSESIEAHLSIFNLAKPDFFYSLPEAQGHVEGSYMLTMQSAIHMNTVRATMESLNNEVQAKLDEKFLK